MDGNSMKNEDKKYTQLVMNDNSFKRFYGKVVGIDEKDIKYKKVLTDDEVKMIPTIKNKKIVMIDNSKNEEEARQKSAESNRINNIIEEKKRQMAIDELIKSGDLKQSDLDKLEG